MSDLSALLDSIAARRPSLIDLGLDRVRAALSALGDPHLSAPPTFHVAGTNGKGSTVAYLRSILEASGASVHVFTSPHLVRYNERITLGGAEITDQALADVLRRCDAAVDQRSLTFFETITCAAFLAFAETPADYLVLEVGLGGRLDATNVIDKPAASVVTPIALDHQAFLGADLASIAREKAGVFKASAPAVVGQQTPEAMASLQQCAENAHADLFAYGVDWQAYAERGRLIYQDERGLSDLAAPRMLGAHQFLNAGLAVAAVRAAGLAIDDEALSEGVSTASVPGRLQLLSRGPLVDALKSSASAASELWLDGGHNPHAARAIAAAFSDLEERSSARLVLIAGMQANKDMVGFFDAFEGLAASVLTVAADHKGAAPADDVAAAAEKAGLPAHPCASVADAIAMASEPGGETLRVLICGSLYLAGEVLARHA
ncbi:MAG: folylpolyglutamate synthase/dihydrofolate synthase family protein [Pseudomonadota bacterium]